MKDTPEGGTSQELPAGRTRDEMGAIASNDPAYRLKTLEDVDQKLVTVAPNDELRRAVTLMMTNNYSQLPVVTGSHTIKGMLSWRSIGLRCALGGILASVRDAMDPNVLVLDEDTSLFDAIPQIAAADYALVQRRNGTHWILTTSDLSVRFRELTEPFLLLSEIENHLRRLVDANLSREAIGQAKDPADADRIVKAAADLTLGEMIRLVEQPSVWDRIAPRLDRTEVVQRLGTIKEVRNRVMHFTPGGVGPSDVEVLRSFAGFLRELARWQSRGGGVDPELSGGRPRAS